MGEPSNVGTARATPASRDCAGRMRRALAPIEQREASPAWAFALLLRTRARNGVALTYEARRVAIDAMVSPAGCAYYASADGGLKAQYRAVFEAALNERGRTLLRPNGQASREPGEDDEPIHATYETESAGQS